MSEGKLLEERQEGAKVLTLHRRIYTYEIVSIFSLMPPRSSLLLLLIHSSGITIKGSRRWPHKAPSVIMYNLPSMYMGKLNTKKEHMTVVAKHNQRILTGLSPPRNFSCLSHGIWIINKSKSFSPHLFYVYLADALTLSLSLYPCPRSPFSHFWVMLLPGCGSRSKRIILARTTVLCSILALCPCWQ